MTNKTLVKNMPNLKWQAIPPVKGPNPQGLIDKSVISTKVKLKDLKNLEDFRTAKKLYFQIRIYYVLTIPKPQVLMLVYNLCQIIIKFIG